MISVRESSVPRLVPDNQYIDGARRSWRDGKTQVLEGLIDDLVVGITAYLVGIKAKRDEQERRERRWRYEAQLRAIQQARAERETKRLAFIKKYGDLAREAGELRSFVETMRGLRTTATDDDFSRMIAWVERRLALLERKLTGDGIGRELATQGLFLAIDPLVDPPPPED